MEQAIIISAADLQALIKNAVNEALEQREQRKAAEGAESLRKILREARAAFARAIVELLPIAPGALHEYEL